MQKTKIEDAALFDMSGQPLPMLGPKHCGERIRVNFPMLTNDDDFTFVLIRADEKNLQKTNCQEKITNGEDKIIFTKSDPFIDGINLLPQDACSKKGGAPGTKELCIYRDHVLAARVIYRYNTRKAVLQSGKSVKDEMAVNGEVSFLIDFLPGGSPVKFQICYGEDPKKIEGTTECNGGPTNGENLLNTPSPKFTLDGLNSKITYTFKVRIVEDGQAQAWSSPFQLRPERVNFPLNDYDGKGGNLEFSCQGSRGSLSMLVFALLLFLGIRLRHKLFPALFMSLLAVCILPTDARADLGQMNFGILGAMYRPDLDNEMVAGKEIFPFYKCHFRKKTSDENGPINPLMGVEADWHLWDGFGSLQLGLGASYTYVKGFGLRLDAKGQPDCNNRYEGASAALHMYQLRPQLNLHL